MHGFDAVLLAGMLTWASATDIARRRIPNVVLATTALLAAVAALSSDDGAAAARLALGAATGLMFALPLFALRALGAGDAKLFAVVGMLVGPALVPKVAAYTAVAGGALALLALIATAHGRRYAARRAAWAARAAPDADPIASPRLPYAVAIAAGTALAMLR
jgi:prepilin peptidase CpaA